MGLSLQGAGFAYVAPASRPNPFVAAPNASSVQMLRFGRLFDDDVLEVTEGNKAKTNKWEELGGLDLFAELANPHSPAHKKFNQYIKERNLFEAFRLHVRSSMTPLSTKGWGQDLCDLQAFHDFFPVLQKQVAPEILLNVLTEKIYDAAIFSALPGRDKGQRLNLYLENLQGLKSLNDPRTLEKLETLLSHPVLLREILNVSLEHNKDLRHNEACKAFLQEGDPWPLYNAFLASTQGLLGLTRQYPIKEQSYRRWFHSDEETERGREPMAQPPKRWRQNTDPGGVGECFPLVGGLELFA